MDHNHKTYLRTHRRRWALTQGELAFLIGTKGNTIVSRIEDQKRSPSLAAAFICELVFATPLVDIFPGLVSEITEGVLERARILYDDLQGDPTNETRIKLDFLENV